MKHLQKHAHNDGDTRFLRELELAAVPAAVEARLRQVYAELPRELPHSYAGPAARGAEEYDEVLPVQVRRMPWALKGALGLCGAAVAACVLLTGLNTVAPEFTESLPGLGGLFAKVNGKNPMGTNLDSYGDELEQVSKVAVAEVESGYQLTVDEAFCEGNYVYFTVEIECPEDADYDFVTPYQLERETEEGDYLWEGGESTFAVDGQQVEPKSIGSTGKVQDGKAAWAYALPLPGTVENGQTVQVSLSVPRLQGFYEKEYDKMDDSREAIQVDFHTEFPVTVNTTHNHINVGEGQDNGVSIKEVESTPGYIKIKIESPMWGYEGEEVYNYGIVKGIPNECYLYTEDGQELDRNSELWEEDPRLELHGQADQEAGNVPWERDWPKKGDMVTHTLGFNGAPADCKKVTLRIFDQSLINWEGDPQGAPKPKLFTELAIDLETGKAEPGDTYLADGFEKIDMEEYINTNHVPDITGGYMRYNSTIIPYRMLNPDKYGYSNETDMNGWSHEVDLFAGVEEPDLEVRFYRGDELLGAVSTPAMDQWEKEEDGLYTYTDENGNFMLMADMKEIRQVMEKIGTGPGPRWNLRFQLNVEEPVDPQWTGDNNRFTDRVEIVRKSTGEVLADNSNSYEVFGA